MKLDPCRNWIIRSILPVSCQSDADLLWPIYISAVNRGALVCGLLLFLWFSSTSTMRKKWLLHLDRHLHLFPVVATQTKLWIGMSAGTKARKSRVLLSSFLSLDLPCGPFSCNMHLVVKLFNWYQIFCSCLSSALFFGYTHVVRA